MALRWEGAVLIPDSVWRQKSQPLPLSRVELHVHLDGALRQQTAWELSKSKGGTDLTFSDYARLLQIGTPKDLKHFLSKFSNWMPSLAGDLHALHRISLEFCEDAALNGVAYFEARFSPHFLAAESALVTPNDVVRTVRNAFQEGEALYSVQGRIILCCIVGQSLETWREVLTLCENNRGKGGVVAIDVAGDEASGTYGGAGNGGASIFAEAKRLGIHRTAHAGEAGSAENVAIALNAFQAERIGHGYRVLEDPHLYKRCLDERVHFETCPTSSVLTGAVSLDTAASLCHPILTFTRDQANFSISTDDPTLTGTRYQQEVDLVRSWGLSEAHIVRSTFNAARASFLPETEKKALLAQLCQVYGMQEAT